MSPERWQRVEGIYHSALERPAGEREVYVADACSGDAGLRQEVESLLREDSNGGGLLDHPVWDVVRELPAVKLASGAQLGPYRIASALGEGGMGEVYRATDTRLGRTVAVKVLHGPHSDRFLREARAISALNHPNICTLYDIGEESGTPYLVMEHVEGETLAARLVKGPLSFAMVLRYGSEIAAALAAAHARGVVHRDLKPSNIMLTSVGVKLLDFGLARILEPPAAEEMPSSQAPATAKGVVIGTVPYMAPEQVEGRKCDARTDVFALGLVLYEMAAGRRAFNADSQAKLMAAILNEEPPPLESKPALPARFEEILRGCLAKDPAERWQSAQDVKKVLALAGGEPPLPPKPVWWRWLALAAVIVALPATLALWLWRPTTPAASAPVRFLLPPPDGRGYSAPNFAVSPDGLQIASVNGAPPSFIWVRRLDSVAAARIEGTQEGRRPFWSPDGRWLAFFGDSKLKKVAVAGGAPQVICDLAASAGAGSWGPDGSIVFTADNVLQRVSAAGGSPAPLTKLNVADGEIGHMWPQHLPNGKHILYLVRNKDSSKSAIYVQAAGSNVRKRLFASRFKALFASPDHLLSLRDDGTLVHQFLDLDSLAMHGDPVSVAESTSRLPSRAAPGAASFSVSDNGVLAHVQETTPSRNLVWRDRAGRQLSRLGEAGPYSQLALSPDANRLAVKLAGNPDLWQFDVSSGARSRLTVGSISGEQSPVWSPDSSRLLTTSSFSETCKIQEITVASRASRPFYSDTGPPCWPGDWSRDGGLVVFHTFDGGSHRVYLLPAATGSEPRLVAEGSYQMDEFHFSPDGRWLAFSSNETGRHEVYAASLPAFAEKRQVSVAGGVQPVWRQDGRGLYFASLDGKLMNVDVQTGAALGTTVPRILFQTALAAPGYQNTYYQVTRDGKRFLFIEEAGPAAPTPLNVVINWTASLVSKN